MTRLSKPRFKEEILLYPAIHREAAAMLKDSMARVPDARVRTDPGYFMIARSSESSEQDQAAEHAVAMVAHPLPGQPFGSPLPPGHAGLKGCSGSGTWQES